MKASLVRRKRRNAVCAATPQRTFKITPTFGNGSRVPVGTCHHYLGTTKRRKHRFGRKRTVAVVCGGQIVGARNGRNRPKVWCVACRKRRSDARLARQAAAPWENAHTGRVTAARSLLRRLVGRAG